jgi:Luciferase-like monooxygenase
VRLGIVIQVGAGTESPDGPLASALDAEEAGLDLALLQGDPGAPADALTAAAFLAAKTSLLRLVAAVPVGPHPIHIAEQAAVADNALGGRLTLLLENDRSAASILAETAEIVIAAGAPRPFAHDGKHWTIPGRVDGNISERRISITPKPAQPELPIWLKGPGAVDTAAELGISLVSGRADSPTAAAAAWAVIERELRRAALRLRRPAIRELDCTADGIFDHTTVVRRLVDEAALWGLDVVMFALPPALERAARSRVIRRLASFVRPQLAMDHVPDHVTAYWGRELEARLDRSAERAAFGAGPR